MVLGIFVDIVLLWMGRKGRMVWLQVWSIGLVLLAVVFLADLYLL